MFTSCCEYLFYLYAELIKKQNSKTHNSAVGFTILKCAPSRGLGLYTTSIPFGYILPSVEFTSKAFRALQKVSQTFFEGTQIENPHKGISFVRPQGLEPWTISLKGSRSTN
jgi:hypothetical protein